MKTMIAIAMFLTAFAAQAEVKPMGTFIPRLCANAGTGARADVIAVTSICVGKLSGMNQQVVKLTLNSGEVRNYAVTFKGGKKGMGRSKSTFNGNDEAGTDLIRGILLTTSGITTTYQINLKTNSNLEFKGFLQPVFTTM